MFAFKKTLEKARDKIRELSQRKQIIFVVDELDRCIPSYAIKVLERMHHFFEGLDQVIVIYAIDSQQLNHSIKSIYGDDTDVDRYLKKFINLQIRLDLGDIHEEMFQQYDSYLSMFEFKTEDEKKKCFKIFKDICRISNFEIRTQEEIMQKVEIIHKLLPNENGVNAALFLVEILVTLVFARVKRESPLRSNLAWIPEILRTYPRGSSGDLGNELLKYLQELYGSISLNGTVSTPRGTYIGINGNHVVDVAYMCLDQLFSDGKIFYIPNVTPYKELIEQCRAFINYSEFML